MSDSKDPVGGKLGCAVCQKPGGKQCKACKRVFYCSAEHQKDDWKRHRKICSPLLLRQNSELNRHFVAARNIKAGTIILEERPLIFGPRVTTSATKDYCLSCCKPIMENASICLKCTWPLFCSQSCTKAKPHVENECKHFTKKKIKLRHFGVPKDVLYRGVMILRALLQKSADASSTSSTWKSIENLQYLRSDNSISSRLNEETVSALGTFFKLKDSEKGGLNRVNIAIDINAFSIERVEADGEEASEATVLFEKGSVFAHSCVPNCTWSIGYSPDFCMRVRVSTAVKKGEILTLSYNPNWGSYGNLQRQKMIQEIGGFVCRCRRCEDPSELSTFMSSLKCPDVRCIGGYLVPFGSADRPGWKCSEGESCFSSETIENRDIMLKTDAVEEEWRETLAGCNFLPPSAAVYLVQKFISFYTGRFLHPNHWILQQASFTIVRMLGSHIKALDEEQLEEFICHCRRLLQLADVLSPGISLQRALIQLYLSRALFVQYKFNKGRKGTTGADHSARIQSLEEIRILQADSFQYWKEDIQSKALNEKMGYEAYQLNDEINAVSAEYQGLINNNFLASGTQPKLP